MTKSLDALDELTSAIARHANEGDVTGDWPADAMTAYGDFGGWRWAVPSSYGGIDLTSAERVRIYAALGRADVSTALIITQRDGAVDLIATGENDRLKREILPACAEGKHFTTVGIAQLTTSRQGADPAMGAVWDSDELVLDGVAPWASGADHADSIVIGAVLPDGDHVLASVPGTTAGMTIDEPIALAALNASRTSAIRCERLRVGRERVILGPRDNVMARRSPVKNWVSSAVGLGLAQAMLDEIAGYRDRLARELEAPVAAAAMCVHQLRDDLLRCASAEGGAEKPVVHEMRIRVNDVLIRLGGIMMIVVKGSGYMAGQTAQRLAREALFFCVWSAPDDIRAGTAERLITGLEG